jgi:UDP-N-acetylmuramate: L-alanyl-gamma-D-glutamyl-meso-diaminopimelate ligase
MSENKSIYIIAVCGTGMSALAGLFKKSGCDVVGSDANIYPPVSELLVKYGIEVKEGYKIENVPLDADLIIVGNAIPKTNPEAVAALESGIRYVSFPEALGEFFLQNRKSLVVAGTHGKTTTSSLLAWMLEGTEKKPGFLIGGWLKNFDSNYGYPEGDYFVVEGDEYDTAFFDKGPKFLHYSPYASILTGIEFDHADIYENLEQIQNNFRKFVSIINPNGFLLVEDSKKNMEGVLNAASCQIETYGFSENADWQIQDYAHSEGIGTFSLLHEKKLVGRFSLPMIGRHNVQNSSAVIAMGLKLGIGPNEINNALAKFKGVKRRQEIVGVKNDIVVMDDFAHHPTAIALTIDAVKEAYPNRRVWAVFEPRSATSRRNSFQDELPESLMAADKVILAKLFFPDKIKPENRFDLEGAVKGLKNKGKDAYLIPEVGDIIDYIVNNSKPGDIVLIMSSGGFDNIHRKLLDRL